MRRILFFILAFVVALTPLYAENITEGTNAGGDLTTGDANIFFGEDAGRKTTTGWGNIFIGEGAGRSNTTGVQNIFLGYLAGNGVAGSNRFYLQTAPYSPTMVAHLDSQKVAINATNALGYSLYVNGTAKVSGAFTAGSTTADSLTSKRFFASIPGGAGNPVFAPSGDKDTGFYFYTATGNRIGVSAKGTQVALFDSAGTGVQTGTAAAPSFHNLNDRDTGFYWLTATGNRIGTTAGGTAVSVFDSAGLGVQTGAVATPSLNNLNDRDTGLYWLTATGNRLGVSAKGANVATFDSSGVAVVGKIAADSVRTVSYITANGSVSTLYRFAAPAGNATEPTFIITGDTDTGIYQVGHNRLGITAKGANVATFDSTGVTVTGGITSTGTATFQAFNTPVQAMLADSTLTAARSGYTYIARPLDGKATATLPSNPAVGTNFTFFVADSESLRITVAGSDSLIDGTGAAWKTTTSVAGWIKATLGLTNKWFLTAYNGTWTSY